MKPLWEVVLDAAHDDNRSLDNEARATRIALAVIDAFLALPPCTECDGPDYITCHKCPACEGRGRRIE